MGWFKHLTHAISHPFVKVAEEAKKVAVVVREAEKKVGNTIENAAVHTAQITVSQVKNLGTNIVTVAGKIESTGEKALAITGKAVDFVEDHAETIKKVVNVTAVVLEAVAVATGQPELLPVIASMQAGADKALDLAAQARQVQDLAEKALLVARAIKEKEKLSDIMHKAGDAIVAGGALSGNEKIVELGHHVKTGAAVVDKAIDHTKELVALAKDVKQAVEKKDFSKVIPLGERAIKEGKKIVGTVKEGKELIAAIKKTKNKKKTVKELKKEERALIKELKKESKALTKLSTKKVKKTKSTRAPSKYNLFVGSHIKAGGTFKSATVAWKAQK